MTRTTRCSLGEASARLRFFLGRVDCACSEALELFQQLLDCQADVFCDLAKQDRRNSSSLVRWNRCPATVRVPKLFV